MIYGLYFVNLRIHNIHIVTVDQIPDHNSANTDTRLDKQDLKLWKINLKPRKHDVELPCAHVMNCTASPKQRHFLSIVLATSMTS